MAVARSGMVIRGLELPRRTLRDESSYMLLRPRTNHKSPKKNEKASSSASSSQPSNQQPGSPNTAASASRTFTSLPQESVPQLGPVKTRRGRTALMFAASYSDPQQSTSKASSSRRSPSPSMQRVSGDPLSAMAIVRGPATVETDTAIPDSKKKVSVAKDDYHFVNIQSKEGISAGAHIFKGGAITAATTGDTTAGTIDTRLGGKGHLVNQRDIGEYSHKVDKGIKFERAIHSEDPSTTNVGTIAMLEGPGALNAGAAEVAPERKETKVYKKYG